MLRRNRILFYVVVPESRYVHGLRENCQKNLEKCSLRFHAKPAELESLKEGFRLQSPRAL